MAIRRKPKRDAKSRSLRRPHDRIPVRKTLLIFCEGAETEPQYIEALRHEDDIRVKAAVELRIESSSSGKAPFTLVESAVNFKKKAAKE